jgi:hypothetical protein
MYDLEARGGFGDAAPEPTGTATISLTEPHAIPAVVLLGVAGVRGKVLRWQQRLRLGNELNPSQDVHCPSHAEARHQVSSQSRGAGFWLGVQSDDGVAVFPNCRPISGATKRRGLRWRRSPRRRDVPKKTLDPLAKIWRIRVQPHPSCT